LSPGSFAIGSIIIDGACLSACTLAIGLLPRGQVCATPKAVLGFHAAWRRAVRTAYPPQGPRACRYGAGLRRWTRHPHPPHDAHDQVVITFRCSQPVRLAPRLVSCSMTLSSLWLSRSDLQSRALLLPPRSSCSAHTVLGLL
jgi:hypothetical protein